MRRLLQCLLRMRACAPHHPPPLLSPAPSPSQDPEYGGDASWVSNDVVQEYDGRIYLNLPASCTLMLVQQG